MDDASRILPEPMADSNVESPALAERTIDADDRQGDSAIASGGASAGAPERRPPVDPSEVAELRPWSQDRTRDPDSDRDCLLRKQPMLLEPLVRPVSAG